METRSGVPTGSVVGCFAYRLDKIAAVANHERQCSKFNGHANTSQRGNWQNFRNAEYNREVNLLSALNTSWFAGQYCNLLRTAPH